MPMGTMRSGAVAVAAIAALMAGWTGPENALAAQPGETIAVAVDQARLVKLPEHVATIVVGNPLIADVSLQSGSMMVVTGKGYGATNVIAMDRNGGVLIDRLIQVEGPADTRLVTVYRGLHRESYSCAPSCQKRVTLGDEKDFFTATLEQAGTLNKEASGGK